MRGRICSTASVNLEVNSGQFYSLVLSFRLICVQNIVRNIERDAVYWNGTDNEGLKFCLSFSSF